ncbi:MAG: hypothetical protein JJU29_16675 [Verrucomicrobia bacterium]|nr:hypothetical protein [Verrucomicrobiota bacterium]MCH8513784.1 hypothetical protein [Kiritimatiellia bacterium]
MNANVSTLLREFPKIRRAALSGETVIIHTREGDLQITALQDEPKPILGALKGMVSFSADDMDQPSVQPEEWDVRL